MKYYTLLHTVHPPHPATNLITIRDPEVEVIKEKIRGKEFAFDFETNGLVIVKPDFLIRCVSIHNDDVSCSIELTDDKGAPLNTEKTQDLLNFLSEQDGKIAHNFPFEGGALYKFTGTAGNCHADTLALFRALGNEGHLDQQWSLEEGMIKLLNWDTNDRDLRAWLKEHKLKKEDMYKAPFSILGRYNQLDSAATWEIYKVFMETTQSYWDSWGQFFMDYHQQDMMTLIINQIDTYNRGLSIDEERLGEYGKELEGEIESSYDKFLNHPQIAKAIQEYDKQIEEAYLQAKPKERFKANGDHHGGYLRSLKNWEESKDSFFESNKFNVNSSRQLNWLVQEVFEIDVQGKAVYLHEKD